MIYVNKETLLDNQTALVLLANVSIHSHDIYKVECDLQCTDKCRKVYDIEYRNFIKYIENNDGKLACIFCSRRKKFSGRKNPNTKYQFDDNFFSSVNTLDKAYLLGWIASDGHVSERGFLISIHKKDFEILKVLRDIICKDVPIRFIKETSQVKFVINSRQISKDLCELLRISPGKKSSKIRFPLLRSGILRILFLRGYFEGDGHICKPTNKLRFPRVGITSNSRSMLDSIDNFVGLKRRYMGKSNIEWSSRWAVQFLNLIYTDDGPLFRMKRKHDIYQYWKCNYSPHVRKKKK